MPTYVGILYNGALNSAHILGVPAFGTFRKISVCKKGDFNSSHASSRGMRKRTMTYFVMKTTKCSDKARATGRDVKKFSSFCFYGMHLSLTLAVKTKNNFLHFAFPLVASETNLTEKRAKYFLILLWNAVTQCRLNAVAATINASVINVQHKTLRVCSPLTWNKVWISVLVTCGKISRLIYLILKKYKSVDENSRADANVHCIYPAWEWRYSIHQLLLLFLCPFSQRLPPFVSK